MDVPLLNASSLIAVFNLTISATSAIATLKE